MRNLVNNHTYDGKFEYDGEIIYYNIVSDGKPIRKRQGKEKMSGYFNYFKSSGDACGISNFYEDYDDMMPMDSSIAEKYYRELYKK